MNGSLSIQEEFWHSLEEKFKQWHGSSRREFLLEVLGFKKKPCGMAASLKALMKKDLGNDVDSIARYNKVCGIIDAVTASLMQNTDEILNLDAFLTALLSDETNTECVPIVDKSLVLRECEVMLEEDHCSPMKLLQAGHVLNCTISTNAGIKTYQVSSHAEDYVQIRNLQEMAGVFQKLSGKAKNGTASVFDKQVLAVLADKIRNSDTYFPIVFVDNGLWFDFGDSASLGNDKYTIDSGRSVIGPQEVTVIPGLNAILDYVCILVPEAGTSGVQAFLMRKV